MIMTDEPQAGGLIDREYILTVLITCLVVVVTIIMYRYFLSKIH